MELLAKIEPNVERGQREIVGSRVKRIARYFLTHDLLSPVSDKDAR